MKLLISNQHGAILMALLPFLYGMLSGTPIWQHSFLLLAWCALYLMSYPFLSLFKGRNLTYYAKWTAIYGGAALLFALPVLQYNFSIFYFLLAMTPCVILNIYFVRQKNERALLNDIAGILIFSIAGMAAYYFSTQNLDLQFYLVGVYSTVFFIGTTFYVKSMLRERKNPYYFKFSVIFHLSCLLILLFLQQYIVALAFVPATIRAFWLKRLKLSPKQVGLIEIGISAVFFIPLILMSL